jgi:hypothetical protein
MGVRMPQIRQVAKQCFKSLTFNEINELINHPIHEVRQSCLSPNNNLAILSVGVNSPRLIKVQVATMGVRMPQIRQVAKQCF